MRILSAVDGTEYAVKAADYLATHFRECPGKLEVHSLNVQLPIPRGLALVQAERLFGGDVDDRDYRDEAQAALTPAEQILRNHHIPFISAFRVGDIVPEIIRYASENAIDMIVMGLTWRAQESVDELGCHQGAGNGRHSGVGCAPGRLSSALASLDQRQDGFLRSQVL